MSTQEKIKNLIAKKIYKTAARQAAKEIVKSAEPQFHELDIIAYKHIVGLFIPRTYELLSKDFKWVMKEPIPLTLQDALDYYEKHIQDRRSPF